jgi:hypothetical protein
MAQLSDAIEPALLMQEVKPVLWQSKAVNALVRRDVLCQHSPCRPEQVSPAFGCFALEPGRNIFQRVSARSRRLSATSLPKRPQLHDSTSLRHLHGLKIQLKTNLVKSFRGFDLSYLL